MLTNQTSVTFSFDKSIEDSVEFNEEYANFLRKVRSIEEGTYTREVIQHSCLDNLLVPEKQVLTECFQTLYNTVQKVSNNARTTRDVIEAVEFFVRMLRYIDGEVPDARVCTMDSCCSREDVQKGTTYIVSSTDTKREILEHFITSFGDILSDESTHSFNDDEVEAIRETVEYFGRILFFDNLPEEEKEWGKELKLGYDTLCNPSDDLCDSSEGGTYTVL